MHGKYLKRNMKVTFGSKPIKIFEGTEKEP